MSAPRLIASFLLLIASAVAAQSQEANCPCHGVCTDPGHPAKPIRTMPGDRNASDHPGKRYCMDDSQRAGNPHVVAPWAKCSTSKKYSAWYTGGGAAYTRVPSLPHPIVKRGRGRKTNAAHGFGEGTWGLDYSGLFGHANVWLGYTRGRKQGGEGAYETDGEPEFVAKAKRLLHLGH